MSRLDLALHKHPEHEEGIRLLAARDPSGKQKYLEWGVKMLTSGQALASEIADVVELFDQFRGHRPSRGRRLNPDIHTYGPNQLASLRDALKSLKRAQDKKRKKREKLYKIEGDIEAEVIYESDDLIVRHIKNKAASAHYGLNTKWCISMLREEYFDDYEAENATFFFFERKKPIGNDFDKSALLMNRNVDSNMSVFTSTDEQVGIGGLVRAYGPRVFDILKSAHLVSLAHPPSAMFQVNTGAATHEEATLVLRSIGAKDLGFHAIKEALIAICCSDQVEWSLLEEVHVKCANLVTEAMNRRRGKRRAIGGREVVRHVLRDVRAALYLHPNVPDDVREQIAKQLKRQHVFLDSIYRSQRGGRVTIEFEGRRRHRRFRRRRPTAAALRRRAVSFRRMADRLCKRASKLEAKSKKKS